MPDVQADTASALTEYEIAVEPPAGGCHILWQEHADFHEAIAAALAFAERIEGRVLSVEEAHDSGGQW